MPGYRQVSPTTKAFARRLRRNATDAELRLNHFLRTRRLSGFKFRRQFPIGNYIADFCCYERRLVIELDGGQHAEKRQQDRLRTEFINQEKFRVLRFWDSEVFSEIDAVLEAILQALRYGSPPP